MIKYITFMAFLILVGCDSQNQVPTQIENNFSYKVITIDNCQYIMARSGYKGYLAHKGDCNNPIHVYTSPANIHKMIQLWAENVEDSLEYYRSK